MPLNPLADHRPCFQTSKCRRLHSPPTSPDRSSVPSIASRSLNPPDIPSPSPPLIPSPRNLHPRRSSTATPRQTSRRSGPCKRAHLAPRAPPAVQLCPQLPPRIFHLDDFAVGRLSNRALVRILTLLLHSRCKLNDHIRTAPPHAFRTLHYPDGSSSLFHSVRVPSVSLCTYVSQFVYELNVPPSVFVAAFVYLDRVAIEDSTLSLTYLNVHRLFTTAVTLAAKFVEDDTFSNAFLGRLGGIPSTLEINLLELQFLRRLRWNCFVSKTVYIAYVQCIISKQSSICCCLAPPNKHLTDSNSNIPP